MKQRFAVFGLLLIATTAVVAQQTEPFDFAARIDSFVNSAMTKQQIPAMTVAVAMGGHITYSKAFGTADLENLVPATTETLIRTGSIAKPISAVAAMTLVESGNLNLDAPIQTYCPAFPKKQWTITTRQLLSHTSGIRHYKTGEIESTKHYKNMSDGFAIFANDPLLFEPGTHYSYSTYGYTVVGCVIEGASKERYADYVREHVLEPTGMTHTYVDDVFDIVPHRARGYTKIDGKVQNAGLMDSSYKIPGGGWDTTAEDLVRLGIALMEGKILKQDSLALMWTPTKLPVWSAANPNGKPSSYGFGFGVSDVHGEKYIAHSGGQQGTSTDMEIIPSRKFAVAAMANMDDVEPFDPIRDILDLLHMPRPGRGN